VCRFSLPFALGVVKFNFRRTARKIDFWAVILNNLSNMLSTEEPATTVCGKIQALTVLSFNSIIPDLLCFSYLEAAGLVIFAAASIVFSFIDFNHLTDPTNNPSIYSTVNDRLYGIRNIFIRVINP
jgi:hypothetical protein